MLCAGDIMKIIWNHDINRLMILFILCYYLLLASCEREWPSGSNGWPPFIEYEPIIIDTHEIWNPRDSAIRIEKDVHVTTSGVLEILPGTNIELVENSVGIWDPAGNWWRMPNFLIEGTLICSGKPDSLIQFLGGDRPSGWQGVIEVRAQSPQLDASILEWTHLMNLEWYHGSPRLSHCDNQYLVIEQCEAVEIDSNQLMDLFVYNSTGKVQWNVFEGVMRVSGDSVHMTHNIFRNISIQREGAIRFSHDSRSLVTENVIEDCGLAFRVFSATPELHRNNIIGNDINMAILPELERPESDTIDATDNWWGTADSSAIANMIEYWLNGETISEKVVKFVPFATEPFDLP
jgi:hypothetical protein